MQVYQDLGLSFEEAAKLARKAIEFNRLLLFSFQDNTTQAERLAAAHAETFESVSAHIKTVTADMANFVDATQLAIQTQQIFDRNRPSFPTVPRTDTSQFDFTPPDTFGDRLRQIMEEDQALRQSLHQQQRYYRQFANLVSKTFVDLATGRAQGFESVATAFIQQSLRIVARAFIEHQIRLRLDDTLTAHKIANIQKVNAAQSAAGAGGIGNLPGLANLGSSLSGGGLALGVSALLFPEQIRNLTGGIRDTIGGFLDNIGQQEVVVSANITNNLRIGENEAREISDMTAELKQDNRA